MSDGRDLVTPNTCEHCEKRENCEICTDGETHSKSAKSYDEPPQTFYLIKNPGDDQNNYILSFDPVDEFTGDTPQIRDAYWNDDAAASRFNSCPTEHAQSSYISACYTPSNDDINSINMVSCSGANSAKRKCSSEPRVCPDCGRVFKYPSDLKKHEQIHTEIKKFICRHCGRSFRRHHQLNVHIRIHTGEKPYVCSLCNMSFRHDSTLTMHTRTRHQHLKPFKCDICDKLFGRLSHLRKHQKYVCATNKKNIMEYVEGSVTPNGEPLRTGCQKCGLIFNEFSSLYQHSLVCDGKYINEDNVEEIDTLNSVDNYSLINGGIKNTFIDCELPTYSSNLKTPLDPNNLDETSQSFYHSSFQPYSQTTTPQSQLSKFPYSFINIDQPPYSGYPPSNLLEYHETPNVIESNESVAQIESFVKNNNTYFDQNTTTFKKDNS